MNNSKKDTTLPNIQPKALTCLTIPTHTPRCHIEDANGHPSLAKETEQECERVANNTPPAQRSRARGLRAESYGGTVCIGPDAVETAIVYALRVVYDATTFVRAGCPEH